MDTQELFHTELRRIIDLLGTKFAPNKVILYGSMNEGVLREGSDIDILIIKETPLPVLRRMQEVYKLLAGLNYRVPVEALVFTPAEVKERLSQGDPFMKEVITKGRTVYERQ